MVDVRGFNGGLNMDSAPELLPSGDYTYAMNINVGAEGMTNILGNRVSGDFPESSYTGTEWICGAFFDKKRQRVIYFTNHSAGKHRIIVYDVPSISKPQGSYIVLFEDVNRIFSYWEVSEVFKPSCLIKDIKVIHRENDGDLYYFIDPKNKVLKFNYYRMVLWGLGDPNICAYGWTKANYDGTLLRDGTPILQVDNNTEWAGLTVPAWCYYNNDSNNNAIYGKLYNWYAISHPLFAPAGYRVPSDTDWQDLIDCLGGDDIAGGKLKSLNLWNSPNTGATNESLFSAVPGGGRGNNGVFSGINDFGYFWTSQEINADLCTSVSISHATSNAGLVLASKKYGYSVRLIKEL
jgi:uncharacterized protein (TIGR02145 family)